MTNARVIVEIPDFAKGKTYSFRDNDTYKYSTPSLTIPTDCKYASVYIHADGYVKGGLGDRLTEDYTSFTDIMEEIICGGDGSCIGGPYHGMRGEEISSVGAKFSNDLSKIRDENYNYLYRDGKWYVREQSETEYSPLSKSFSVDEIDEFEEKLFFLEEEIKKTENYLKHQKYVAEKYQNKIQNLKENITHGKITDGIDG